VVIQRLATATAVQTTPMSLSADLLVMTALRIPTVLLCQQALSLVFVILEVLVQMEDPAH